MPTQRFHGGAPLIPIPLLAPGQFGLNTEAEATLLPPQWATVLNNAVFDGAGRAATRKGWLTQTTSAVSGTIMRVFEYVQADGTVETISSTDADIFTGRTTPSSIEGSLGISEGNIKFVNLNDKCIAIGTGTSGNPSVYTGSGNFTTVTVATGTAPTGTVGTAAFGRLWVCDADGKTIRYCALIDETKWATADGGGTIDMSKVWPYGQDIVMGIAEFAGDLVVFGQNQIVVWTDGQGSNNGIDPTVIYISDTIPGTGLVTQFATCNVKGDLWFLSPSGVQSLKRVFQEKTTPLTNISKNVQSKVLAYLADEGDENDITMTFSPAEDLVLLIFPTSAKIVVFDTRLQLEDGSYRCAEWTTLLQTASYHTSDRQLYGSFSDTAGEILKYTGYKDNGSFYDFGYTSGWLDLGNDLNPYLKFVKRMTSFLFIRANTDITFNLYYDFSTAAAGSITDSISAQTGAEFNVSEFGTNGSRNPASGDYTPGVDVSEYSGSVSLQSLSVPGEGNGQYIKVGATLSTQASEFSLQQINLYAKIGRLA